MRLKHLIFILLTGLHFSASVCAQSSAYAENSVLSQGKWYKIAVLENGVYRLDLAFFNSLGIDTRTLDPRNIRIYGIGSGMLPQSNRAFRNDDLVENAIQVLGEEDGKFDAADAVLFYAGSPHAWNYDPVRNSYNHTLNLYSDTAFYFLNLDQGLGKRIKDQVYAAQPDTVLTRSRNYVFYEKELSNFLKSGRYWLGESFSDLVTNRKFSFYVPDADPTGTIRISLRMAARSDKETQFQISLFNKALGTIAVRPVSLFSDTGVRYNSRTETFQVSGAEVQRDSLSILIRYQRNSTGQSDAWLDWIEIDYDRRLDARNADISYYSNPQQFAAFTLLTTRLANADDQYQLWDITNPLSVSRMPYEVVDQTLQFALRGDVETRWLAFKGGFKRPVKSGAIPNQNLHGLPLADYLMIVPPIFLGQATRLAQFHRQHYGRSVHVVTPQQVYNEFSGGRQDVSAIRDFIRMFYVRSGKKQPGFVLLFGDGSYDFKGILSGGNPAGSVITYQSRDGWTPTESYTSDDFFVLLDEEDGYWGERSLVEGDNTLEINFLDAAIGRLPVSSVEEAKDMIDKIIAYATDKSGFGPWRNRVVLIADYKPEDPPNLHISQSDGFTNAILRANACMQVDKIFMDNYELVPSASRYTFPDGRKALLDALDQGSLIVNYTGHGSENKWSDADIFVNTDIRKMRNGLRQPLVVTATCEFGRYDDPLRKSGAEEMLLRSEGGAISLLTTVRLVYSQPNKVLNDNFYREVFKFDIQKGRMPSIGEVMMRTKNATFPNFNTNSRNFTLLGDPGLILNYPELKAVITSINGLPNDNQVQDTLRALSKVKLGGVIQDQSGKIIERYNGDLDITVYDKPTTFLTKPFGYDFSWQLNRIFKGVAGVKNGVFNFEFVVPIDISYEDGQGKISLYSTGDSVDGQGCYSNLYIGGTDAQAQADTKGPQVEIFLNDYDWKDGGKTGSDPILLARINDENGINTLGTGIGHEMIAYLGDEQSDAFILNDFYTAQKDSYTFGTLRYPLKDIEKGEHEITLRVWDIANNATEVKTRFIVAGNAQEALSSVLNYPNPVKDFTRFQIEHNQVGNNLAITVRIYDAGGRRVKELSETFFSIENTFDGLQWGGENEQGIPLSNGLYTYQVIISNEDTGEIVRNVKKLVLLK